MNLISEPTTQDARVTAAVEQYLAACDAGRRPSRPEFLVQHADIADALAECLDGLDFIRSAAPGLKDSALSAPAAEPIQPEGPLGDFRIVREIGRGGMGVVYEAMQISLGRRVALKVLPFASTLDSKQLQRFKNEAQAAAGLHHQSIVPVYATGCERGVHYYAMQYIEGQTLAGVIAELRNKAQQERAAANRPPLTPPEAAHAIQTVPWVPNENRLEDSWPTAPDEGMPLSVAGLTAPQAGISTERSTRSPAFFRAVVQLGVQAAEALEHAHQLGIVHRDIKPANLLVDGRGNLWVTDFGLAHCQSQAGLTMSGDLVGTLRYMSPEQALAQRVTIDHRTDIYSLGATLYELLTLEPAFPGTDRQELLRQIAFEEPRPPRRRNKAIPTELETIVLKVMEKNPADRYATAQDLADDLRRYLEDKPIRARKPTLWQKGKKWARRNRAVVWTAGVCLLIGLAIATGSVGWIMHEQAGRWSLVKEKVQSAMNDADELQSQARWPEALEAVNRADGILAQSSDVELRLHVAELRKDLEMALFLEKIRGWHGWHRAYHPSAVDAAYAQAFRDYGIDVEVLDAEEAAKRICTRSIRLELTLALDAWADVRRECTKTGDTSWKRLSAVSGSCDPDDWRNQVRDAWKKGDHETLNKLVAAANISDLPPRTVYFLLGCPLDRERRLSVLRQAQRGHPDDFEINFALGTELGQEARSQEDLDEVIRFYTAALALRPHDLAGYRGLADVLLQRGKFEEAIALYRKATTIKPESGAPQRGQMHDRLARILADYPDTKVRDPGLAVQYAMEAVELAPHNLGFWQALGVARYRAGDWVGAIAALERSEELRKEQRESGGMTTFATSSEWFFLAMAHWKLGNHERARQWYKQAVQRMDKEQPKTEGLPRHRAEAEELVGAKFD